MRSLNNTSVAQKCGYGCLFAGLRSYLQGTMRPLLLTPAAIQIISVEECRFFETGSCYRENLVSKSKFHPLTKEKMFKFTGLASHLSLLLLDSF